MPAIVAIPELLVLTLYLHSMALFPDFETKRLILSKVK